jgi:hypothetical protein
LKSFEAGSAADKQGDHVGEHRWRG